MRRWSFVLIFGLTLGLLISWVDLPFENAFYDVLMGLRGSQPANPEIVIATFPLTDSLSREETPWLPLLKDFFVKLESQRPKAVVIYFDLEENELNVLRPDGLPFPVIWPHPFSRRSAEIHIPQLATSPANIRALPEPDTDRAASFGGFDSSLLALLAPEKASKLASNRSRLINVVGPPGSFAKIEINSALRDSALIRKLKGSILLIAPPSTKSHAHFGPAPYFPRDGSAGETAVELDANAIDSVLRERTIEVPPRFTVYLLTIGVSLLTTVVLFSTVPLLGILTVVLVLAGLVLAGLIALNHFVYLDISKPVFAIAIAYYFLVPYRLIIEYKGRWRYQEEARLLSEVETLKDNFMSLVSHNLKTPIARIQGIAEALLSSRASDPKILRAELEKILRSGEDLHKFVSRVLSLTRVERPEFQLTMANKDLNAMIERLIEAHRNPAMERNITVATSLEPLFPLLMDGDLIQESIANLIENALKYTPPGGRVEIVTSEADAWVNIEVRDSGPGVGTEDRDRIFQKFYRGSQAKNQGVRGSGLGLYLVKYFVELHGGSVAVCDREGGGSVFTIRIPRK